MVNKSVSFFLQEEKKALNNKEKMPGKWEWDVVSRPLRAQYKMQNPQAPKVWGNEQGTGVTQNHYSSMLEGKFGKNFVQFKVEKEIASQYFVIYLSSSFKPAVSRL